ncbi:hypothetical protein ACLOJK_027811 [Asimina triloba]
MDFANGYERAVERRCQDKGNADFATSNVAPVLKTKWGIEAEMASDNVHVIDGVAVIPNNLPETSSGKLATKNSQAQDYAVVAISGLLLVCYATRSKNLAVAALAGEGVVE